MYEICYTDWMNTKKTGVTFDNLDDAWNWIEGNAPTLALGLKVDVIHDIANDE